ncbi:LexA family transcriptional regulator [Xanthobacter flavus]|uniref:XRE family transcriptional regulator n=1 Tax=Xanthobacter flavus TaxID=281 RepID=UPI00372635CB
MNEKVVNKALGERVKQAREAAGLTQSQLAAAIGSEGKQSAIAEIEAGRVRRPKRLHEIAKATGTTMEWLLGLSEPRRPKAKPPQSEHIDSEDIAASLDRDSESIRQTEPPFDGAIAQITGHIGGGSTGEVVTMPAGDMQTIEPVAAWWKIPGEALTGFGFRDIMPAHIVGWFMDGASMEPTIQRTDVVFIDTRRRAPDPEGIFAVDYGEGRTLKRIRVMRTPEGVKFELRSDNAERFSPVTCAPDEVTIFGRYLFRFTVF